LKEVKIDALRTTLGTVPGTVLGVIATGVQMGICRWTFLAVPMLALAAKARGFWKVI